MTPHLHKLIVVTRTQRRKYSTLLRFRFQNARLSEPRSDDCQLQNRTAPGSGESQWCSTCTESIVLACGERTSCDRSRGAQAISYGGDACNGQRAFREPTHERVRVLVMYEGEALNQTSLRMATGGVDIRRHDSFHDWIGVFRSTKPILSTWMDGSSAETRTSCHRCMMLVPRLMLNVSEHNCRHLWPTQDPRRNDSSREKMATPQRSLDSI
ncbi:hypothetical protein C8Q77DRAFT_344809 [Trametes polyzona]|nr:hypothetical protein C8Q77DRAFT_344809 [Trametes polyzona]